jgi:hypothetical protein
MKTRTSVSKSLRGDWLRLLQVTAKLIFLPILGMLSGIWVFKSLDAYPTLRAIAEADLVGSRAGDFIAFYSAAKAALLGEPERAYDIQYIADSALSIFGTAVRLPWAYPPHFTIALTPLGLFGPGAALVLWLAFLLLAAVAAVRLVSGWNWASLAPLYPGCVWTFACAQNGTLTALLLAAFYRFYERPWICGFVVALLSYKPQFLPIPMLILALNRRWNALAVGAGCAAAFGLISLGFGFEPWVQFVEAFAQHGSRFYAGRLQSVRMYSPAAFLIGQGYPIMAMAMTIITAATAALLSWKGWKSESPTTRAWALAAGALLFTPYGFDYDFAVLLLPLAVTLQTTREYKPAQACFVAALVVLPFIAMIGTVKLEFQIAGFVLLLVAVLIHFRDPWSRPGVRHGIVAAVEP